MNYQFINRSNNNNKSQIPETLGMLIGIIFVISTPFITIWAINTIFNLNIAYNLNTYFAVTWLIGLFIILTNVRRSK